MLLTIATTHRPATDLGYLLHKNPERVHSADMAFGRVLMFYPERSESCCRFALALDVDPVGLVRGKGGSNDRGGLVDQYVNDRPYVASSFLSVAIARALRNALGGVSRERAELARTAIPLEASVLPLPVRGSEVMVERLFGPLGYEIAVEELPLDEQWPEWGASPYVALTLRGVTLLRDLLAHLYVLIPVLDRKKHYFVDRHELEKLLAKGEGWLGGHPERELIAHRYLRHKRSWAKEVLERLAPEEVAPDDGTDLLPSDHAETAAAASGEEAVAGTRKDTAEEALEKPIRLHERRLDAVAHVLKASGARRVVDLGCGSGKLLKRLMAEKQFTEILGLDVSSLSLDLAARRLKLATLPERQRKRIRLLQGALTYRDRRIAGFDAAALVEVIEHLETDRIAALERVVLEHARPGLVVITTPNAEYNVRFEGMRPGQMRHADHRFEWTRAEFQGWANRAAARFGYRATFHGLGEEDPALGSPSQMAVLELDAG
jgi:3' terminal RNA ribose 2'-O-methyltransferase Hen1